MGCPLARGAAMPIAARTAAAAVPLAPPRHAVLFPCLRSAASTQTPDHFSWRPGWGHAEGHAEGHAAWNMHQPERCCCQFMAAEFLTVRRRVELQSVAGTAR